MTEEGVKYDQEKPRFDLMPPRAQLRVVEVLTYGAAKYAPDNWLKVANGPDGYRRYAAACMRHFNAWQRGEAIDPESGHHHLAHAACCLLFILEAGELGSMEGREDEACENKTSPQSSNTVKPFHPAYTQLDDPFRIDPASGRPSAR